ncbi:AAA family ATPase [uncultured Chitinophaga sp.]
MIESNGTKRYFGLGGPLYGLIHRSHLLCIDELETSLHPDLMNIFCRSF